VGKRGRNMSEYSVLLVDDEADVLNALKRLFRNHGHIKVFDAGDAREGLRILGQNRIDLVISDQRMPGVEGHKFLSYVKEHFPDVVRIMLSGYAEQENMLEAINTGEVYRFITKPWDNRDLLVTVEKALQHGAMERENRRLAEELKVKNDHLEELNRELEEKVRQRTEHLEKAVATIRQQRDLARRSLEDTALFLGSLVEMFHKDVSDRVGRIAELVRKVMTELDLPGNERRPVLMAAYFCEIGGFWKKKEGEGEEEKTIPELSEHLIRSVLKLGDLAEIVRHYQENYNGSGLPDMIEGEAIPLGSRILRVCRDYDQLSNERGLSFKEAGSFLLQHEGDLYDGKITRALLSRLESGEGSARRVKICDLKEGMVLSGTIYLNSGELFLPVGTEISADVVERIEKFSEHIDKNREVYVTVN
jgi:response regulator RpfG family c-di-GMP phosphodiesterase